MIEYFTCDFQKLFLMICCHLDLFRDLLIKYEYKDSCLGTHSLQEFLRQLVMKAGKTAHYDFSWDYLHMAEAFKP